MALVDPRRNYLKNVSVERVKVLTQPPIVFLFGGPTHTGAPASVRSELMHFLASKQSFESYCLVVPEDFKDWLNDAVYPDLLTFELDLAQTATLVVIALESAGAIAELGVFVSEESLKDKLLVVITTEHYEEQSFIRLGPLRQLDSDRNIVAYPFTYGEHLSSTLQVHLEGIADCIMDLTGGIPKEVAFSQENAGHVAFLIHELLLLFRALKLGEISHYLEALGLKIPQARLKRLLFLLEKLDLARSEKWGRVTFYYATGKEQRIDLVSKPGTRAVDRPAILVAVGTYYDDCSAEHDRKKFIGSRLK